MASNTYNLNTYKSIFLAKQPTLTVGATGKTFNGTVSVSWSMNEIMGSSDSTKFYRGDKTWSDTLTGRLYLTTIAQSTNDHTGQLSIESASTLAGGQYFSSIAAMAPNVGNSQHLLLIGTTRSAKNSAYYGFHYSGTSGSDDNYATIGLYGVDQVLNIRANGCVGIGTTTPTYKLQINGTTYSSQTIYSGASASTDLTHIPTDSEIALSTSDGNGTISAWIWREKWASANYGIFHNNSTDVIHIVGNSTSRFSVNLNDGACVINGNLSVGKAGNSNYITFYGITGDNPVQWSQHDYIGNRLWGSPESSELVLFKGNDVGNGTSATTVSGSGPDRIRHIAAAHLFQTYSSALSGSFEAVCTSSSLVNVFEINTDNLTGYKRMILQENNSWLSPARLQLLRPDTTAYTDRACVGVTDGNLHIDPYPNKGLYLNYYNSGGNVYFNGGTYYINGGNYNGNAATASQLYVTGSSGTLYLTGVPEYATKNQTQYIYSPNYINGGNYYGYGLLMPTNVTSYAASQPMGICYGRVQCYGTLYINANTDNSGTEYVILTAGHGVSSTLADGLWVASDSVGLKHGYLYVGGSSGRRALLYLRSEQDVPNDFWLGTNNSDKWSITCRESGSSYFLGFYSAVNSCWRMRLYHNGENYCDGAWHVNGHLYASDNLYVNTNNTTGGGIILSDDGDIVDNNDGYCSIRFSKGVCISSANRGGNAVITLSNAGVIQGSSVSVSGDSKASRFVCLAGSSNNTVLFQWPNAGSYHEDVIYASYGTVYFRGRTTDYSSKYIKKDIHSISDDFANKILLLNPVSFKYKYNEYDTDTHIGLIAEEVENVISEAVTTPPDYDEQAFINYDNKSPLPRPKGIVYETFIPYLIALAQSQQKQIDQLNHKIAMLSSQ